MTQPTRLAYLDAQAGISGDMVLGALVGLGLPPTFFEELARRLGLPGVTVRAASVRRAGIQGWQVTIDVAEPPHVHRHLADIEALLDQAGLPAPVAAQARQVFHTLARAEAEVHGAPVEQVHFHEVGAIDSLLDVVGAVAGLHELGVQEVRASSLPLAPGTVTFSHGTHPLPAPAVACLVAGLQVHGLPAGCGETVTPTGAALVRALAQSQGPLPRMRVVGHGRGAGRRDQGPVANLLRIFLGEQTEPELHAAGPSQGEARLVAAALDDMNPQLYPAAMAQLFAAGAVDVTVTPLLMKKGRPGHLLEALCTPEAEAGVVDALLRHTTSLGCRITPVRKVALARQERLVRTPFGEVPVKVALLDGEVLRQQPEYEVAARLAREQGVPVARVLAAAARVAGEEGLGAGELRRIPPLHGSTPESGLLVEHEHEHGHEHEQEHGHTQGHEHEHEHAHQHPG